MNCYLFLLAKMVVTILSRGTFSELNVSLKHFFLPTLFFFNKAASLIHPKEIPPEAILLAVYLELQNGRFWNVLLM